MSMWHVDLRHAHTFPDMTPIPDRLLPPPFQIEVFDDMDADGDWAVSDSIKRHGIWEPVETAVLCSAFAGNRGWAFIDIGCHVGWYTVLARQWDLAVIAVDASAECVQMLRDRGDAKIAVFHEWIKEGYMFPAEVIPGSTVIVKMDIEGAEAHAVNALRQGFIHHDIHIALIEMSPVFNQSYVTVATTLIKWGYECWVLPPKQTPPPQMDDTRSWLTRECYGLHDLTEKARREWINDQHQFNAVVCLPEAKWG